MTRTMIRTLAVRSVLPSVCLFLAACGHSTDDTASAPTEELIARATPAARSFCGNGRCDHGETCSTCAQDCGSCTGTGGTTGTGGSTGGTTGTGGAGGSGGVAGVCGSNASPPNHYDHVVIFAFENRTWSNVGLGFSATTMPYLHALASQCSYFSDWTETNTKQDSLTQYIGETSGVDNPNTVNDCNPSTKCESTDNNIFRQVRQAGGTARNYVEGATTGCSAAGNAAKHIPGLYYFGSYTDTTGTHHDNDFCNTEVRPYTEFDPNNLPTYAFVTPTLCNDGHDCGDAVVDAWASANIQPVLDSAAYKAGTVAVFVWYDEDHPTPNVQIALTSHQGDITQTGIGSHAALLKTIEDMLNLTPMSQGQLPAATDLRTILGI
jgi:hypothetical protein